MPKVERFEPRKKPAMLELMIGSTPMILLPCLGLVKAEMTMVGLRKAHLIGAELFAVVSLSQSK